MNEIQSNSAQDRDDFLYALKQTLMFYGKDLDRMQTSFWWTACNDKPIVKLKQALIEYTKVGKFAPRPADILTLVDSMTINTGQRSKTFATPKTNCPPSIAEAWSWFLGRISEDCTNPSFRIFESSSEIDISTQEKYLHTVNHEAHKYSMPESIPDEFKIKEVWGSSQ
tara:strand:+ start:1634 stop:2137 length:504 start_codon:yes stop_codon:yes gene_type:complete